MCQPRKMRGGRDTARVSRPTVPLPESGSGQGLGARTIAVPHLATREPPHSKGPTLCRPEDPMHPRHQPRVFPPRHSERNGSGVTIACGAEFSEDSEVKNPCVTCIDRRSITPCQTQCLPRQLDRYCGGVFLVRDNSQNRKPPERRGVFITETRILCDAGNPFRGGTARCCVRCLLIERIEPPKTRHIRFMRVR
jgi:hypothetical protein